MNLKEKNESIRKCEWMRFSLSDSQLSRLVVTGMNRKGVELRWVTYEAQQSGTIMLTQGYGMKSDSVTDAHLAQLDPTRIRRVTIDGVRFAMSRHKNALRVGDASLQLFAEHKNFPTIVLDRCGVTTRTVCDYTEEFTVALAASLPQESPSNLKTISEIQSQDFDKEA
uniref:Hpr_kinase_N domain-containing protein n=1 Tax=Heterorhabditis bacteriophora TaxID=37862 RepID=A0A1I7XSH1_HETBA